MAKEVIRVVAAVIEHDRRYLITQRNAAAVLPLLWEFPGGRIEGGENEAHALIREVKGRIGVEVVVGPKLGEHLPRLHDVPGPAHDVLVQAARGGAALPRPPWPTCAG